MDLSDFMERNENPFSIFSSPPPPAAHLAQNGWFKDGRTSQDTGTHTQTQINISTDRPTDGQTRHAMGRHTRKQLAYNWSVSQSAGIQ